MSEIAVVSEPIAALGFQVLAHLDLGRDAANLYDARLPKRPWSDSLLLAYRRAPGRLTLHAVPLAARNEAESWDLLSRSRALADPAGQTLARTFMQALTIEQPAFDDRWTADKTRAARLRDAAANLVPLLARLRAALVEEPPPLVLLDCPALGPHGRACWRAGERRVAVSLAQPLEHVVCQILHEEAHAVSDPEVRAGQCEAHRDTRAGTPGHALHLALERAAVATGARAIEKAEPALEGAYAAWCARYGMRPDGAPLRAA
jgi:hypothetical protein